MRTLLRDKYQLELANIVIEQPPKIALGEYALPLAFELAKSLRKPPRKAACARSFQHGRDCDATRIDRVTSVRTARGIHFVHVHEPVLINADLRQLYRRYSSHQEVDDNLNE